MVEAGNDGEKDFLIGAKPMTVAHHSDEERNRLLGQYIDSFQMSRQDEGAFSRNTCFLDALCRMGTLKFFWKDRDRSFLGASSAFLSYFGLADEKPFWEKRTKTWTGNWETAPIKRKKKKSSIAA